MACKKRKSSWMFGANRKKKSVPRDDCSASLGKATWRRTMALGMDCFYPLLTPMKASYITCCFDLMMSQFKLTGTLFTQLLGESILKKKKKKKLLQVVCDHSTELQEACQIKYDQIFDLFIFQFSQHIDITALNKKSNQLTLSARPARHFLH